MGRRRTAIGSLRASKIGPHRALLKRQCGMSSADVVGRSNGSKLTCSCSVCHRILITSRWWKLIATSSEFSGSVLCPSWVRSHCVPSIGRGLKCSKCNCFFLVLLQDHPRRHLPQGVTMCKYNLLTSKGKILGSLLLKIHGLGPALLGRVLKRRGLTSFRTECFRVSTACCGEDC